MLILLLIITVLTGALSLIAWAVLWFKKSKKVKLWLIILIASLTIFFSAASIFQKLSSLPLK